MPGKQAKTLPVDTRARRRRFSGGQRVFIAVLVVAVVLSVASLALAAVANSEIERIGHLPELAPGRGVYLIVGSDSRADLPPDLEGNFGDFDGTRTDVIMLAQVSDGSRQLLSIPRDLMVEIPGHGTERINAAYELGGPGLLVETVARETGIRPNHYVEIDFAGFAGIVDALGGIRLTFPHPSRDTRSGLSVEEGSLRVDGATALAFARSRHLEERRGDSWVPVAGGDIERTARQRTVLLEILDSAFSPLQLVRAPWTIRQIGSSLSVDSDLRVLELVATAWSMRVADQTETRALPVKAGDAEGSTLVRDEPHASETLEAFSQRRELPAR